MESPPANSNVEPVVGDRHPTASAASGGGSTDSLKVHDSNQDAPADVCHICYANRRFAGIIYAIFGQSASEGLRHAGRAVAVVLKGIG